ncbi:MAG: ATP-dependent 6-phosphofructokinase [Myxococcota bacterium]
MATKRIGILTGGGDAPGLNAVIRAFVKSAAGVEGWEIIGIEDSFDGLLEVPHRLRPLTPKSCQGLLHRGGTMLGTTNRGNPFSYPGAQDTVDRSGELADRIRAQGFDGLVVIGGDGTQEIGYHMMKRHNIPVIGVPKTIDNDLACTDYTFGFWSAVDVATEALDRLHTTAESHDRVMLLEVMGRTAGWIALYAGVAGGADAIAIPEIPYDPDRFVAKIQQRRARGRHFTLIVVAEGAKPAEGSALPIEVSHGQGSIKAGGAAQTLAQLIADRDPAESRVTVLGHLQRGGSPVPFDRVLATRFGVKAVELVKADLWGNLVRLENDRITHVPLEDAVGSPRHVDPNHPLIATARAVGIEMGAPA